MLDMLKDWPKGEKVPAISLRQPWAAAVCFFGKNVENRSNWPFKYRGPMLIHASQTKPHIDDIRAVLKIAKDAGVGTENEWVRDMTECVSTMQCPAWFLFGCIVAIADLTDVFGPEDEIPDEHPASDSPWVDDDANYLLCLENRVALTPIEYKGAVGMFKVPYEVASKLKRLPRGDG